MTKGPDPSTVPPQYRPTMPGGPYIFPIPTHLKFAYAFCALSIALLVAMAEYLYVYNVRQLAGEFGLTSAQASWASAAYYGFGASNALVVIKARIQFGTRRMFITMMGVYLAGSIPVLLHPSFATLVIGRACNGACYSMGIAMAVYYMLVIVPPDRRYFAPMTALGTLLMSSTIAGLVPIDFLAHDNAIGFRLICIAIPCYLMMLALLFPLTPTDRIHVFNKGDALSIAIGVPGILCLAGALSQGRTYWWTQVPWVGAMLAVGIGLVAAMLVREHRRSHPMLHVEWMTEAPFLMLVFVVIFERVGLAEQSAGMRGLFATMGYDSDQLHPLQLAILTGQLCGLGILALTFRPERIPWIMLAAMFVTSVAAWQDGALNGLIGPQDVALTQALIGGASVIFVICGLLFAIGRVMQSGPYNLLGTILIFAFTQNMGGLVGSALVGSYQTIAADSVQTQIAAWLPDNSAFFASAPTARAALQSLASAPSTVLGYLDAFRFVSVLTMGGAIALALRLTWVRTHAAIQNTAPDQSQT